MVHSVVRHFLYDFSHSVDSVTWLWATKLANWMGVGSRLQGHAADCSRLMATPEVRLRAPSTHRLVSIPGILSLGLLQICAVAGGCSLVGKADPKSSAQVKPHTQSQGNNTTILTSKSSILLGMDFPCPPFLMTLSFHHAM